MLSYKKAIFPLLAGIFALLFELSVSAQCGPGKTPFEVQGFGSVAMQSLSVGPPEYVLGAPNGSAAQLYDNGDYIVIDFIDTVLAGQEYVIYWRQRSGASGISTLNWSESLTYGSYDPPRNITTSNEELFSQSVTATNDFRYIRIFNNNGSDFEVDAVSYTTVKCFSSICAPGFSGHLLSGNALPLEAADIKDVNNARSIAGVPDGSYASFNSSGDWVIINLPYTIPTGQIYSLVWRPIDQTGVAFSRISIEESDGSTWGPVKLASAYYGQSSSFLVEQVTASQNTNRLRIRLDPGSDYFYLDAIVFHTLSCDPPPPVLGVSGDYEFCGLPVSISTGLTISDPADQVISAAYVQIGTGFQPGQDLVSCTLAYGITSTYLPQFGLLILKGPATTSQFQSVLRTVVYSNSSGTPSPGSREVTLSLERINHTTGHYYRYVPYPSLRWHDSRIYADRTLLFGMQGYLVTIGSAEENAFLLSQMAGGAIWVGASDFYSSEGDWKWVTGPEAGTSFWLGDENGTELTYANWDTGEPNDNGNQDFCHFLTDGTWDDNNFNLGSGIYRPDGFYVEFGGMPGDAVIDISGTVTVNVVSGVPVNPVITGPATVCPNATGQVYSTPNVSGHNYFWEVTGGTISGGQNTNSITVSWGNVTPGIVRVTERIGASCQVTTTDYAVSIADNSLPTWVTAAGALNVTLQCNDAGGLVTAQSMFPVATDNCDNDVSNIVKVTGTFVPAATCTEEGNYTNTWTN